MPAWIGAEALLRRTAPDVTGLFRVLRGGIASGDEERRLVWPALYAARGRKKGFFPPWNPLHHLLLLHGAVPGSGA